MPVSSQVWISSRKYAKKWLRSNANNAKVKANSKMRGAPIRMTFRTSGGTSVAALIATGKAVVFRAIDQKFYVPAGGLRPKTARAFPIVKSSGEVRFRARTYSNPKYWNRVVKLRGKLSKAVDDVFGKKGVPEENFTQLADRLADQYADSLANMIANEYRSAGYRATVTRG